MSERNSPRRRVRRAFLAPALAGGAALALLAALASGGSAYAADNTTPPGVNIRVTTVPGVQANVPAAPPASSSTSPTTTRTTVNGSTTVTGSTTPPTPGPDDYSIGGILYVSGLSTEYTPSINPLSGQLRARFTVLNVSGTIIDSTARFSSTNAFGAEFSVVDSVPIAGLKPNESRVVDATLDGVGQWTFVNAHFTLTPPETVEGVTLAPITRDTFVFVPPWLLLIFAAVAAGAYAIVRIVSYDEEPALVGSTA
ncbi:hypothetical protein VD659_05055 [Herbiconiux sp. 11R-BC]|uniref:hypothetical protein n=1 Tax=Herbiconiux sp. 11R-BC TaxID=3111637 RepID=UPI003BFD749B